MKKNTISAAIAVVVLMTAGLLTGIDVQGQQADEKLYAGAGSRSLEGPWLVTVTVRNCQTGDAVRSFPRTITFAQGGTLSEFAAAVAPNLRGPGQGSWTFESSGYFTYALHFLRFNADGTYGGRVVERRELQVSPDERSFTATGSGVVYNANGDVVVQTCATEDGVRFE